MLKRVYKISKLLLLASIVFSLTPLKGVCVEVASSGDNSNYESVISYLSSRSNDGSHVLDGAAIDTTTLAATMDSIELLQQPQDTIALKELDSVANGGGVTIDSTLSASVRGRFVSDTLVIKGGVLPISREVFFDEQKSGAMRYDSIYGLARKSQKELRKDSIMVADSSANARFSKTVQRSFLIPGYGQIKNKQSWKLPILYGSVGSFVGLTVNASKNYKRYNTLYESALFDGTSTSERDNLLKERNKYNTQKTLYLAGAAISYLYFVSDAAINFKGDVHPTRKATILSAVLPGAGQVYNKSYWKLPIIYGGFAVFGYIIDYNNRGYKRFSTAYNYLTDGDDSTVDEFNGAYSSTLLENTRDSYRRYRDLGIIMTCGFYLLNVIEAHVDAYLRQYDVSDDLSLRVEPTYTPGNFYPGSGSGSVGLAMKFNF